MLGCEFPEVRTIYFSAPNRYRSEQGKEGASLIMLSMSLPPGSPQELYFHLGIFRVVGTHKRLPKH